MLIGGIAVMKYIFSRQVARERGTSTTGESAGVRWLRRHNGRVRWIIPVWIVFWLLVLLLSSGG
jgi:hypothetical protein